MAEATEQLRAGGNRALILGATLLATFLTAMEATVVSTAMPTIIGELRRTIPATPPDRVETWREDAVLLRAEVWADLVRPDAAADGPTITGLAIHDPRHRAPLLLATSLSLAPRAARDCYRDRWPVEQLPWAAKQMLGAARQFVHAPETCQRLPELALLARAVLSSAAATAPAIPTGCWDRRPPPTPGRLRRFLARTPLPQDSPCPHASAKKRPRRPIAPRDSGGSGIPLPRPPHPRPLPKRPELPQTGELTDGTKVL